jgi:hypothetical protein
LRLFLLVVLASASACASDARTARAPAHADTVAAAAPRISATLASARSDDESGELSAEPQSSDTARAASPARRVERLGEAEQRVADRVVFAPRNTERFVVASRARRLLLDVGRVDLEVKGKADELALVRRVAARVGPLAGVTHVRVHGTWGVETDSIVGYDVWNGRAVAVLRVEPRTDSLLRRGVALVGVAARAHTPPASETPHPSFRASEAIGGIGPSAARAPDPATVTPAGHATVPTTPACVRDSVADSLRARVSVVRDSLVRWMTDSLRSPFPRLAQATAVRGDAVIGCFGAWRAGVIATSRTPTLVWNEERARLVGPEGKVSTARLRDLRLRAHELPVALDADGDGIDELAVRGLATRMGALSVLRLDPATRRFARLASGFAWEAL